ncbi:MAG: gamma carbonic anhydrase family protein [Rubrimonas sp.]|uniref:gamma carbonic anhydrase family protein n=1 Tax=Rubrimonas sp. TaxID=2036015 RepID=UPI002FDF081F
MELLTLDGETPDLPEDGDAFVAPGARLIGKVILRPGASVWFNAVLRGDNEVIEVGAGSNVQDLCVIHTDPGCPCVIGPDVTVGHRAILHGCVIGENSLIGMGAVILNGAKIGRDCLIGANALITEGKEIPDGSLVMGQPGKVVRALDPDAIAGLRKSAERYRWNARRYRAGLTRAE